MIHLINDLYLERDSFQFIVKRRNVVKNKKSKNFGKETFSNVGYYPRLGQLIESVYLNELLACDYRTLAEMDIRSKQLIRELRNSIKTIEDNFK